MGLGTGFGVLWEPFDPGDLCAQHLSQYRLFGPCVCDGQQMSPSRPASPGQCGRALWVKIQRTVRRVGKGDPAR